MPTYLVVNSTIDNPELLDEYVRAAGATLGIVPVKVLAADAECQTIEGEPAGPRTVILGFESEPTSARGTTLPSTRRSSACVTPRPRASVSWSTVSEVPVPCRGSDAMCPVRLTANQDPDRFTKQHTT